MLRGHVGFLILQPYKRVCGLRWTREVARHLTDVAPGETIAVAQSRGLEVAPPCRVIYRDLEAGHVGMKLKTACARVE